MPTRLIGQATGWIGTQFRTAFQGGLDLLFVPHCTICGVELAEGAALAICDDCRPRLLPTEGPVCGRCGASLPASLSGDRTCQACQKRRLRFQQLVALGDYQGLLRDSVLQLKRPGQEPLARALTQLLGEKIRKTVLAEPPDLVCPIPMHWQRRWLRGTSSPELIAEQLAGQLGVPIARRLLKRRRNTLPQADLSPSERFRNLRGAFVVSTTYVLNSARILVVDDILTTGATCSAAAGVLKRAGAAHVAVAVLARAASPS